MPTRSDLASLLVSALVILSTVGVVTAGGLATADDGRAAAALSSPAVAPATTSVAVSGTITVDGAPAVADRAVFAPTDGSDPTTAVTDDVGAYTATVPGDTRLVEGYFEGSGSGFDPFVADGTADIHADSLQNLSSATTLTMDVPEGHNVSVTVQNGNGEALENAEVRVADFVPGTDAYLYLEENTTADGTLPNVELNGSVGYYVDPAGTTYDEVFPRETITGDTTTTITVPAAVSATATVQDNSETNVDGATLVWYARDESVPYATETVAVTAGQTESVTLRDGKQYRSVLLQGDFTDDGAAEVTAVDGIPDMVSLETFTPSSDSDISKSYTLPSATTVEVRVLDADDDPVTGADVEVRPNQSSEVGIDGVTNASGYVVLDGRSSADIELSDDATVEVDPTDDSLPEKNLTVAVDTSVAEQTQTVYLTNNTTLTGTLYRGVETKVTTGRVVTRRSTTGSTSGSASVESLSFPSFTVYPWQDVEQDVAYLQTGATLNRDGLVDQYALGRLTPGSSSVSTGTMTLPDGHVVNVTVTDEGGNPVEGAEVAVRHGDGDGPLLRTYESPPVSSGNVTQTYTTDAAGKLNASTFDEPGIELAGNVTITVQPPDDGAFADRNYTVERDVTEAADRDVTVTLAAPSEDDGGSTGGGGPTEPAFVGSPSLSLDADELDFGRVGVDATATRTLTLANDGTAPLAVSDVGVQGADAFAVSGALADGGTVAPGDSAAVTVGFTPPFDGDYRGTLVVDNNASESTKVALSGAGVASNLSVTPASVAFGPVRVGESTTRTVVVENTGDAETTLATPTVSGTGDVTVDDASETTLAPGESRNVTLRFAPNASGHVSGTLTVGDGGTSLSVGFEGSGIAPNVAVEPTALGFEDAAVGDELTRTLVVENTGVAALDVTSVRLTGTGSEAFSVDTDGFSVASGSRRQLAVTFAPETAGDFSATLQLRTNDPENARVDVWLSNTETVVERTTQTRNDTTRVNVSVENPVPGQPVEINTSTPETLAGNVSVDSLTLDVETSESFTLNASVGEDPAVSTESFELSDGTLGLGYLNLAHSVPDEEVGDVEFEFRVKKQRLRDTGTPADEVVLHRYADGGWSKLPTSVVSESDDYVVFRAQSPGLSNFVVGGEQAKFELLEALVDVSQLTVGDEMAVRVRITNVGAADGAFTAQLLLNQEVVQERDITIAADGTRQATFERELGEPGQYAVRVNDERAGDVTVELPANGTANVSATVTASGGGDATTAGGDGDGGDGSTSLGFPGFGVGVALAALLGATMLLARRAES